MHRYFDRKNVRIYSDERSPIMSVLPVPDITDGDLVAEWTPKHSCRSPDPSVSLGYRRTIRSLYRKSPNHIDRRWWATDRTILQTVDNNPILKCCKEKDPLQVYTI